MAFIDLGKAYDRVPREVLWWVLKSKKVPNNYIQVLKGTYDRGVKGDCTIGGESRDFPITIGLHQGSALNSYLFALVLDEITKNI